MLSRAVNSFQPPPQKKEKPALTAIVSSASPSSIGEMLKGGRQSTQKSLGGYTNFTNSKMATQSNLAKPSYKNVPATINNIKPFTGVRERKRLSSEMNGFAATLNKSNSFQDSYQGNVPDSFNHVDLTQENSPVKVSKPAQPVFDFNPDDFEDDSDLDLDIEYPTALPPMSSPRQPLNQVSANLTLPTLPIKISSPNHLQVPPTSSAISWSSSPLSHFGPPAVFSRQQDQPIQRSPLPPVSSEPSIDANPRPAKKRRSMPWRVSKEKERIEAEQLGNINDEEEQKVPSRVFNGDEYVANPGNFTPLPKTTKDLPWDKTASTVKNEQRAARKPKLQRPKGKNISLDEMHEAVKANLKERIAPIFLSEEQRNVSDLVINRKQSVFFTGSAGTGKSVLMRSIIADLRRKHVKDPERVAVTASTGLAACNIGGVTLHSFGGIGLGKEEVPELVKKIRRNPKAKNRWLRTQILIIDEISMVDGELFDKLEGIARIIKNNGRTFGGIQLVITGDFFQLPPVPDYGKNRDIKFAFEAGTWPTAINHTIGLTEVFRQRDPVFANMLNEMRLGNISDETLKTFRKLERDLDHGDALQATELFPTRGEVDSANSFKMRSLQGKLWPFRAIDSGSVKEVAIRDRLLANCMAPPLLELKKGAQVMLIKNIDEGLVNGSLGQVIAFMDEDKYEYYQENEDEFQDIENLGLEETERRFPTNKKLQAMRNPELIGSTSQVFPVVRFVLADGTTRDFRCKPEDWKIELPNGEIQAQRQQVPLILAWALSIHKAQGQTLERVKVDLKRVFENGQAYVALSRAVSQDGLCVKNFNKKAVMAHPRVATFYTSLYSVNAALKHPKVAKAPKINFSNITAKEYENDFKNAKLEDSGTYGFDDDDEEAMAAFA